MKTHQFVAVVVTVSKNLNLLFLQVLLNLVRKKGPARLTVVIMTQEK